MFCEKCGKEIGSNYLFCGNCGNKLHKLVGINEFKPASWWKRAVNYTLDGIIGAVFIFTVVILMSIISTLVGSGYISQIIDESSTGLYIILVSISIFYYVIFEYVWAKTPAKFFTNTRVVTNEGNRPGFITITVRTLIRIIPIDFLSFLSARPTGWHDRWSKTIVIDDEKIS